MQVLQASCPPPHLHPPSPRPECLCNHRAQGHCPVSAAKPCDSSCFSAFLKYFSVSFNYSLPCCFGWLIADNHMFLILGLHFFQRLVGFDSRFLLTFPFSAKGTFFCCFLHLTPLHFLIIPPPAHMSAHPCCIFLRVSLEIVTMTHGYHSIGQVLVLECCAVLTAKPQVVHIQDH